ncbi:MAG: hypothetical protein HRF42_02565 [Candidatus Brocadia sp.]
MHCKACQRKWPLTIFRWAVPEGDWNHR